MDEEIEIPTVKKDDVAEYPHGKVGEKETAKLTKRQLKHIARRSGKSVAELDGLRFYLKIRGDEPRIAYKVVAE